MGSSEPGEDVLDLGRHPRVPRWAYPAGGLLVAVVVAGSVIAATHGGPSHPAATQTGAPAGSSALISPAVPISPAEANTNDALILDGRLFRAEYGALYRYTFDRPDAPRRDGVLPISGLDELLPGSSYHLVGDSAAHLVWLVGYGGAPTTLLAVDTRTLAVRARVSWPQDVEVAAALDGHLYLVTDNAVVEVPVTGAPVTLARLDSRYTSVSADPSRHRLLFFDVASRRPVAYTPASGAIRRGPRLPFGKGELLVDGAGHIWAGGYRYTTGGGAVLARLDARTLRRAATSPLVSRLGPGAQLVAAGDAVIWVRAGAGGAGLWCVDGASGRVAQHWTVLGRVTSTTGRAYVTTAAGQAASSDVEPLYLRGCRG
jgi:hypothetical protein